MQIKKIVAPPVYEAEHTLFPGGPNFSAKSDDSLEWEVFVGTQYWYTFSKAELRSLAEFFLLLADHDAEDA